MSDESNDAPEEPPADSPQRAFFTPGMRWVLAGLAAIVLVGGVISLWFISGGPASNGIAGGSTSATDAAASDGPEYGQTPTVGPTPGATPADGSEVLAPTARPDYALPTVTPAPPLVSPPLPKSASASGDLVKGYPDDIMPPMDGSDVLQSSIATEDSRMQVTLVARTDASPDEVTAFYKKWWDSLGLTITDPAGSALAYTGGYESLTLAFSPATGTGTIYNISGVFRTD